MNEHTMYDTHRIVKRALETGILAPEPCEVCGEKRVLAHHDDYRFPLKVRWLCHKHHQAHHREHGEGENRFWFERDWFKSEEILFLGAEIIIRGRWHRVDQTITVGNRQKVRVIALE